MYKGFAKFEKISYALKVKHYKLRENQIITDLDKNFNEVRHSLNIVMANPHLVKFYTWWCEESQFLPHYDPRETQR